MGAQGGGGGGDALPMNGVHLEREGWGHRGGGRCTINEWGAFREGGVGAQGGGEMHYQ